ncbi:DUF1254 domain-containing protein [Coralliovum pocilloporae]|uniref:DUF1254 domain-containing protein n=1 Tax=Coralliovum pocilloporae TaxID=3066369 RepID=UPI003306A4A0
MNRFTKAVLSGLVLGGILHIIIILLIPHHASRDAWSQVGKLGPTDAFHPVPQSIAGAAGLAEQDPFLIQAVCRFSLANAAREIKASISAPFWSVGLFTPLGIAVFSANDSASDQSELRLMVITPLQLAGIQENQDADFSDALMVETSEQDLFVVLRAFASSTREAERLTKELGEASCTAYQPELIDDGRIR